MIEQNDDRSGKAAWWADALDPMQNLRSLTDPRGVGRRAAEELADRLLGWGKHRNGTRDANGNRPSNADLDQLIRRFRADAVAAGDVLASVIDNASTLLSILLSRPRGRQAQTGMTPLVLESVVPDTEATAVFWVHNTAPTAVPAVRPHCTPLRSHIGSELCPASVQFDPPVLDPLPPRSSCGIEVRLRVPPSTAPGTYASVILASNVPELYLPICVTVVPEEPGPAEPASAEPVSEG